MKLKSITAVCMMVGIFVSKNSQAQVPHISLYAHGLYATALDKSSQNFYKDGFGGVAGVTAGKENTFFVGSVGYTTFGSNLPTSDPRNYGDETYIPVKLGVRQHLPLILSFLFLQADAGAGFISYKSNPNNDTRFAFDVGAGAQFG